MYDVGFTTRDAFNDLEAWVKTASQNRAELVIV